MAEGFICRRGGGGSNKSTIIVTAPAGSTVTATMGDKVKTAAEKNGQWIFRNCDPGTWKIEAKRDGRTTSNNVEISEDGQMFRYYVTLSFWTATINVTYPAGAVCTCSNGGSVLTAPNTSGSHTFEVYNAGTWTVKAVDGSYQDIVSINVTNEQAYSANLAFKLVVVPNEVGFPQSSWGAAWNTYSQQDYAQVFVGADVTVSLGTKDNIDGRGYQAPTGFIWLDLTDYRSMFIIGTIYDDSNEKGQSSYFVRLYDGSGSLITDWSVALAGHSSAPLNIGIDITNVYGGCRVDFLQYTWYGVSAGRPSRFVLTDFRLEK